MVVDKSNNGTHYLTKQKKVVAISFVKNVKIPFSVSMSREYAHILKKTLENTDINISFESRKILNKQTKLYTDKDWSKFLSLDIKSIRNQILKRIQKFDKRPYSISFIDLWNRSVKGGSIK